DAHIRSQQGVVVNEEAETVTLSDGAYIGYRNMNFDNGIGQFLLNYEAAGAGGLELRLGSPSGELIKTYSLTATDERLKLASFEHDENETIYGNNGGNNDVYFVYRG